MTTNRKRNSLWVLGCGAATLFAACSSGDSSQEPDAGPVVTGPVTLFDFASSTQGWYFNDYQAMSDGAPAELLNLASARVPFTGERPTLGWDGTVGNPPGSLKLVVNFTGFDQNVIANVQFKPDTLDWTDKVVSIEMKLDPGFEELYTGGIQLLAQDTSWAGTWQWRTWPPDTEWYTYELDMTMAAMQTDDVVQFGIQVISGDTAGATIDENGNPVFTPTTVTLYLDNVVVN